MGMSVAEYLDESGQRKGAVEVLVKIDPGGSRRKELGERVNIAPNTLSRRLLEARKAGLVTMSSPDDPEKTHNEYTLTPKGARVRHELEEREVDKIYSLLDTYLERVAKRIEETREWAKEHPDELVDTRSNYNILDYYQTEPADFTRKRSDSEDE